VRHTAGILRELGRMPDFLGGPIYAGAWSENGDALLAVTSPIYLT
jgi:hypothetical protein